jgi:hypothetical protein
MGETFLGAHDVYLTQTRAPMRPPFFAQLIFLALVVCFMYTVDIMFRFCDSKA